MTDVVDISRPLDREPFRAEFAGRPVVVPHRDAAWWLGVLGCTAPRYTLLRAAIARDVHWIRDAILDGEATRHDVERVSLALLGHVTGTGAQWWTGWNLAQISASTDAVGALTLRGVDPARCTLAQWCAAAQTLYLDGAKEEQRVKFMAATQMVPAGYDAGDAWDDGMTLGQAQTLARTIAR